MGPHSPLAAILASSEASCFCRSGDRALDDHTANAHPHTRVSFTMELGIHAAGGTANMGLLLQLALRDLAGAPLT